MAILVDRHFQFTRLLDNDLPGELDNQQRLAIDEDLQAMIVQSQSRRLDDQRTPLPTEQKDEMFLNLLARLQGARMDDQRASLHLEHTPTDPSEEYEQPQTEEEFVELLFRCQSSRINDQRSPDPQTYRRNLMPGEDFFNLLQHLQSTRIEDQRTPFPLPSH